MRLPSLALEKLSRSAHPPAPLLRPHSPAQSPNSGAFPPRISLSRQLELRFAQFELTFGSYLMEWWERGIFLATAALCLLSLAAVLGRGVAGLLRLALNGAPV